jgi:hypothetical protein
VHGRDSEVVHDDVIRHVLNEPPPGAHAKAWQVSWYSTAAVSEGSASGRG